MTAPPRFEPVAISDESTVVAEFSADSNVRDGAYQRFFGLANNQDEE